MSITAKMRLGGTKTNFVAVVFLSPLCCAAAISFLMMSEQKQQLIPVLWMMLFMRGLTMLQVFHAHR